MQKRVRVVNYCVTAYLWKAGEGCELHVTAYLWETGEGCEL